MESVKPKELSPKFCRNIGRLGGIEGAVTLFWTESGIEIAVKGSELAAEIEAGYEIFDLWIDIIIDGQLIQRRMLDQGLNKVVIFRNMDPDTVKNVKILRDTQAMPDDSKSYIDIKKLFYKGELTEVPRYKRNLEFIGDSITSGEGLIGHRELTDWIPYCFSAAGTYWELTAGEMNAASSVLSQSGWGVYCSYEGNPAKTLPPYYDRICGVLSGEEEQKRGSQEAFDPGLQDNTDAVIINLGTNDASGLSIYGNKDGFKNTALRFLMQIHQMHPDACIIWVYGMLGNPLQREIKEAVDQYNQLTEDMKHKAYTVWADNTNPEEMGAREHPGKAAHSKTAKKLTEFLSNLLS